MDNLSLLKKINCCIIIPTYNNEKTLEKVINKTLNLYAGDSIIVINDGSTDKTPFILKKFENKIITISYTENNGKGYAIKKGIAKAIDLGFENVITIDSDGQHMPEDIILLIHKSIKHPGKVIMGSRNMKQEDVPSKSSFGNKFSNFWFFVETLIKLNDTQTGFRLYPLTPIREIKLYTNKFEFEIEIIVRLAWKNVLFESTPINVSYNREERVSHFNPVKDFTRISLLNCILVPLAIFYYYPKKVFSRKTFLNIRNEAIKSKESNQSKALSLAFGCFMGIVPIWGLQLIIGIPLAIIFKMNKVLFIAAANISIPPMIPFIVYLSYLCGGLVTDKNNYNNEIYEFSINNIHDFSIQYVVGAFLLAFLAFIFVFILSYLVLNIIRPSIN